MHPDPAHHPAVFPEPPWARPEQAQAEGELRAIEAQVQATLAEVEAATQVLGELQRRLQTLEAQEAEARARAAYLVEHGAFGAGAASAPAHVGPPGGIDRRRHGRVKVTDVLCSMGKVLDVSASGCKVETKGRPPFSPGEVFSMWISCTAVGSFTLTARIVWIKKIGMFKHLCGVCFEELDAEARTGLMTIVATAAGREIGWES